MAEDSLSAKLTAEFVGTFLLVFTVGCNVLSGNPVWGITSIAAVLMVSIYALADSSGANFNPAVSVALALSGELNVREAVMYCGVQVLAGFIAALSYGVLFWRVFPLAPGPGFQWWQAGLVEFLYTMMLCFVVLNVACAKKIKNDQVEFFGLAIGFVIIAGGYGGGVVSGGCFNPAVALGIDISAANIQFGWSLAYIVFELAGAAAAAGLFRLLRPDNFVQPTPDYKLFDYDLYVKCISEFLGTYMLVLTVGLNVLGGSKAAAWSIAASLMCMIYALGSCSGAHFNPAVTIAILISGRNKISTLHGLAYCATQIMGGILAAVTYCSIYHWSSILLGPQSRYHWAQALAAEVIFTFVLCYVVLTVATVADSEKNFFGLAIGSCVTVGGFAIGGVSGGSLNPAVSAGLSATSVGQGGLPYSIIVFLSYGLAEIGGGCIAAGLFFLTHKTEYSKGFAKDHRSLPSYSG